MKIYCSPTVNHMLDLNKNFKNSITDLIGLLDKNYPKNATIELVGNRYSLNHDERMILYRGVFDTPGAGRRRDKRVDLSREKIEKLIIDGYNVLITLESYLRGKTVFRSMDGYIRDISGLYGNHTFSECTGRCIELLIGFIKTGTAGKKNVPFGVSIYLDSPVSRSGELADYLRKCLENENIEAKVSVIKNPDSAVIEESSCFSSSAAATSDTVIIDRVTRCVDIPDYVIKSVFHKEIQDLQMLTRVKKKLKNHS